jgi:beta-N-acetylhexosaminidase
MPRSPLPRRRSRSVVVRRSARLPLDRRSRPLVTRYGPVAAHQPVPVAAPAPGVRPPAQRSAPPITDQPARSAPATQEPPTTVFSPEGLVAWALAPDDGPPTTVLYPGPPAPWSPGADEAGARSSTTGAHRVSGPRFPALRLRFRGRRPPVDGADPGAAVRRPGGGWRIPGRRLAARASGIVIPAPRRSRLGRRTAVPLVVALVVGIGLALLAVLPTRPQTGAPPAQAALVAPGQVTGLALGDDRLPDCTPVVATLSPRQKLAQRLMVGVVATDPAATARLVHEMQVGGIFVGGTATRLLTDQALRGVQAASRLPLAVAVDDEGGRVQRIDALDGDLPSARTLASTVGPADVQQIARNRGRQLAASGITMNFAPDVDVSDQAGNAVIGDRSFSPDADTVTGYAAAYAQGEHEAGIFTVLKHFPGHGHADGDSHRSRVTTPPLDQLKTDDLTPYAGLLRPGGPLADPAQTGVMVGHLDVPGLTADLPASLTPATYRLLRDTYHFDGLTITDDLGAMKAISDELALPEAVQRALGAGADMALWTSNDPVTPVLDGLERGLASGALDPKANDAAVERVLAAKGVCTRR